MKNGSGPSSVSTEVDYPERGVTQEAAEPSLAAAAAALGGVAAAGLALAFVLYRKGRPRLS